VERLALLRPLYRARGLGGHGTHAGCSPRGRGHCARTAEARRLLRPAVPRNLPLAPPLAGPSQQRGRCPHAPAPRHPGRSPEMRFKRTPRPRQCASPSARRATRNGRPAGSARSWSSFACGRGDGRHRSNRCRANAMTQAPDEERPLERRGEHSMLRAHLSRRRGRSPTYTFPPPTSAKRPRSTATYSAGTSTTQTATDPASTRPTAGSAVRGSATTSPPPSPVCCPTSTSTRSRTRHHTLSHDGGAQPAHPHLQPHRLTATVHIERYPC